MDQRVLGDHCTASSSLLHKSGQHVVALVVYFFCVPIESHGSGWSSEKRTAVIIADVSSPLFRDECGLMITRTNIVNQLLNTIHTRERLFHARSSDLLDAVLEPVRVLFGQ